MATPTSQTTPLFQIKGDSSVLKQADSADFKDQRPANLMVDLRAYWALALKQRFLILGSVLLFAVLAIILTLLTTPTYTSTATIQIDREAARVLKTEDSSGEAMIPGQEFILTQYGLLKARSLAQRVAESQGFLSSDSYLEAMGVEPPTGESLSRSQRTGLRRDAVISSLQSNLDVTPISGSRLVKLSFNSPDPRLSAQVANSFAENFIQANLDRRYQSTSYARTFLEQRIAQTKARLEEAERQLVRYAADNQIITIDSSAEGGAPQPLINTNLAAMNAALAQARAARISAEQAWNRARSAALTSLPEVQQNSTFQRLSEERVKLSAKYEQDLRIYQADYPSMVQTKAQLDELDSEMQRISNEIRSSIQNRYDVALAQERGMQAEVEILKRGVLDVRERGIQHDILKRELDTTRTLYDGLLQRYKEVTATDGVATNNIAIIDVADVPRAPSKPVLVLNIAVGILLGLALGGSAAILIDALDETLASPDAVEEKLGLPVLGAIPLLDPGVTPQEALTNTRSKFSEAYYSLLTAVQFSTADGAPKTIAVTSAQPAEGKSTTAVALAVKLARTGRRVLLVDGDLRNPSLHRVLGVQNTSGLSNILSGGGSLNDLVQPSQYANLAILTCGPLPPNPAELWSGQRVERLLTDAGHAFDNVVIDGPPVLGFADAPLLTSAVGGTIFVVQAGGTRRAQARGALRRLMVGEGRVLGVVLTKFSTKLSGYGAYDYRYDYHYGTGDEEQYGGVQRKAAHVGT